MTRAFLLGCVFSLGVVLAVPGANAASNAVDGFGQDVPLSFVVKQIVPAGYNVSYGGISQNMRVSWSSGPNWESVLRQADAHGTHLSVDVSGSNVLISNADAAYVGPTPTVSAYEAPSSAPMTAEMATAPQDAAGLEVLPYTPPAPAPMTVSVPTPEPVVAPVAVAPVPVVAPVAVVADPAPPPGITALGPAVAPVQTLASVVGSPAIEPSAIASAPAPVPLSPHLTARQRRHLAAMAERPAMQLKSDEPTMSADPRVVSSDGTLWHARRDQTLDEVLGDWADKAGWTLVFQSRMIYELQASADFEGDFVGAASSLIRSVRASPQPIAHFFEGNRTLVIYNHSDQTN
jgi:hypothetical protein